MLAFRENLFSVGAEILEVFYEPFKKFTSSGEGWRYLVSQLYSINLVVLKKGVHDFSVQLIS